ncbi:MAG: hypothetical protein U1E63_06750 [Burkholderiales bacterium]
MELKAGVIEGANDDLLASVAHDMAARRRAHQVVFSERLFPP